MVRASKTASTSNVSATPVAPVSVDNVQKPKAVKKTAKVVEPVVAPVADVSVDTVVPETETIDAVSVLDLLSAYGAKVHQHVAEAVQLKNEFKALEKRVQREIKNAQKKASNRKRTSGNRQPSGFIKPTLISNELASFLGKPVGTELARTAVSREINQYIRANSLQEPTNGRKINPDAKLSKLLKIGKDEELTYFNLQRYMKHHFVKVDPAVAPVPTTTA